MNFKEFVPVRTSSLLKTYKPLTRTVLKEHFDYEFVRVRISSLFINLKELTVNLNRTLKSSHQLIAVSCFKNLKRINNELTTNSQRTRCLILYISSTCWLFKHACAQLKSNLKEFVRVRTSSLLKTYKPLTRAVLKEYFDFEFVRVRTSSLFIILEAFTTSQRNPCFSLVSGSYPFVVENNLYQEMN